MTTPADIVNRATQFIGGYNNQGPVTGSPPNFDGSPIGLAAGTLYAGVVQTVGRQFGYDFSRNTAALVLSGNAAPFPWAFEYLYPTNGIQVRTLLPASLADPFDPVPINFDVANVSVGAAPTKVIHSNEPSAAATFTNQPPETLWDALFTEQVVRLLAEELALAIPGRPDTSRDLLTEAQAFGALGEQRAN